jgi:acetaldehyde dehydrogenase/alcohol dehydrogenase
VIGPDAPNRAAITDSNNSAFHPSIQKCNSFAAQMMREAAIAAGAPTGCVQWVDVPSLEATWYLMGHPGIALIVANYGE